MYFNLENFNWYGLIVSAAIICGWLIARYQAKIYKISKDLVDDGLIFCLPAAIVGARLYHVVDRWDYYQKNLAETIAIWQGGIGIWGAIIFGSIALIIYCRVKKIKLISALDLTSGSFVLAQAIGRLGNFVNHEAFGPPTALPWKIYIPQSYRPQAYINDKYFHPTFFYDLAINLLIFLLGFFFLKRMSKYPGLTFSFYAAFYAVGRFFVEFFRFDTWSIGIFKVAQLLSVLLFIIASVIIVKIAYKLK
jgi:phosphatidylglycerol:prolipoprotein diacylglycerol transferase